MTDREDLDKTRLSARIPNRKISNFSSGTVRRLALSRLGRMKG